MSIIICDDDNNSNNNKNKSDKMMLQVQKTSYKEPTTVVLTSRAFLNQPHRLIVPNFGLKMDGTGNDMHSFDISNIMVHYIIPIITGRNWLGGFQTSICAVSKISIAFRINFIRYVFTGLLEKGCASFSMKLFRRANSRF